MKTFKIIKDSYIINSDGTIEFTLEPAIELNDDEDNLAVIEIDDDGTLEISVE